MEELFLLIGSYGKGSQECISLCKFNTESGDSELVKGFIGIAEPSYQVFLPTLGGDSNIGGSASRVFYSVSEVNDSEAKLCAYRLEEVDGAEAGVQLRLINEQKTFGGSPCYIWLDPHGRFAATANYGGANISIFPIAADASLLPPQVIEYEGGYPDSKRQSYPHPHCIYSSHDGKYLYVNDLGCDKIYKYEICATGLKAATPICLEKGEGPRHTVFHPNSKWAYMIGEISGKVTFFEYNSENGDLSQIQQVEADPLHAAGSADIRISPDGRFLYASNRLQGDGIAIFKINSQNGLLTYVGYQPTAIHPRNFIISPNGEYLLCACRDSNVVQVFKVDLISGLLCNTCKDIAISKPVCLNLF